MYLNYVDPDYAQRFANTALAGNHRMQMPSDNNCISQVTPSVNINNNEEKGTEEAMESTNESVYS